MPLQLFIKMRQGFFFSRVIFYFSEMMFMYSCTKEYINYSSDIKKKQTGVWLYSGLLFSKVSYEKRTLYSAFL